MPKVIRPTLDYIWNKYLVWIYKKAESLIYPSELARSLLDKLSDKNQPSTVVSNGINLREFQSMDIGDFHERFNIPNNKIKLFIRWTTIPGKIY